jgi:oligopeptide transport system ATP-binding protein
MELANTSSVEQQQEIKKQISEAKLDCVNKLKITKAEAKRRALEIMREVGIPQPERRFRQYPFEW